MRPTAINLDANTSMSTIRSQPQDSKQRHPRQPHRGGRSNAPMTFFMRSEEDMERASGMKSEVEDSTYGIRSINSNASFMEVDDSANEHEEKSRDRSEQSMLHSVSRSDSPFMPDLVRHHTRVNSSTGSSPIPPESRVEGPFTPLLLQSPIPCSSAGSGVPSTPKSVSLRSLRLSDDEYSLDEATSQVLTSSGEDEEEVEETLLAGEGGTESAPQLVMPSIRMPSRRPFTERGKNVGKLKIMVAGAKGIGKSSLIRSMVNLCEDIVHVDSCTGSSTSLTASRNTQFTLSQHIDVLKGSTRDITEIPASTRAYPTWWAELDESRVLRKRRRSVNETVLERNVCFIDTPGVNTDEADQSLLNLTQHVEGLLWRNQSFTSFSDGELLSIFSGNGGVQVDVVLYLLSGVPIAAELDLLKRLSKLTNLIPLIGHADTFSSDEIVDLKHSILQTLTEADIQPFLFGESVEDCTSEDTSDDEKPSPPFTISSIPSNDLDSMDSSLLMNPAYTESLSPSNLRHFVRLIFDPNTTAWLRHLSARKFLQWRRDTFGLPTVTNTSNNNSNGLGILNGFPLPTFTTTTAAASTTSTATNSTLSSYTSPQLQPHRSPTRNSTARSNQLIPAYPKIPSTSPFTAARLADHTLREERLTQVRLARWASDLQRSLRNERERYAALQRGERRKWLVERLEECAEADAAAASTTNTGNEEKHLSRHRSATLTAGGSNGGYARDPLGLLALDERLRSGAGIVVLEVAGACGLMGALAVWAIRSWAVWKAQVVGGSVGGVGGGEGGGWGSWLWSS